MTWQDFTALLVLATAMSFTPGPNTTISTALAAQGGLRHALPFVMSVPVGWSLLLALCAAGVGALVLALPTLRGAIQALGMGYLLWLAWQLAGRRQLAQTAQGGLSIGFGQGVLLQFLNIKAWLLALTLVAGWVAGQPNALARLAIVTPVLLAYALLSNLTYAVVGALLRDWLSQGARLLWFNRTMAALLVLTAIWMVQV